MNSSLDRSIKIVKKALGTKNIDVSSEINKTDKWDSLGQLRVIMEVENYLKKKIKFTDIEKINTVKKISIFIDQNQ
tara:strand:- start:3173 stop:3400 length:228 start_codon:yes stop_codon:yes gene_type:complete